MITITLRLFASARDMAGCGSLPCTLPDAAPAGEVIAVLSSRNPEFERWSHVLRLAVNGEYVQTDHPLRDKDEVAVIPPVSGG